MFLQRRCVLLWLALWAFAGSAFGQTLLSIVDASGQPVTSVLQGRALELRATDGSASGGTLSAEVTSVLGGDSEVVQLTEIPLSSGQFTGSIPMSWAPAATLDDGLLTVGEAAGPPVSFDTVTAVLSCAITPGWWTAPMSPPPPNLAATRKQCICRRPAPTPASSPAASPRPTTRRRPATTCCRSRQAAGSPSPI
jgi:hypothetical protein